MSLPVASNDTKDNNCCFFEEKNKELIFAELKLIAKSPSYCTKKYCSDINFISV